MQAYMEGEDPEVLEAQEVVPRQAAQPVVVQIQLNQHLHFLEGLVCEGRQVIVRQVQSHQLVKAAYTQLSDRCMSGQKLSKHTSLLQIAFKFKFVVFGISS